VVNSLEAIIEHITNQKHLFF
jgi:hypothetical protein